MKNIPSPLLRPVVMRESIHHRPVFPGVMEKSERVKRAISHWIARGHAAPDLQEVILCGARVNGPVDWEALAAEIPRRHASPANWSPRNMTVLESRKASEMFQAEVLAGSLLDITESGHASQVLLNYWFLIPKSDGVNFRRVDDVRWANDHSSVRRGLRRHGA